MHLRPVYTSQTKAKKGEMKDKKDRNAIWKDLPMHAKTQFDGMKHKTIYVSLDQLKTPE